MEYYLLDLLDLLECPAECEGPLSEVWEEEVNTSCSSPHPLFTMFDPGVSAGAVDVEPVPVDVEDLLDVDALSLGNNGTSFINCHSTVHSIKIYVNFLEFLFWFTLNNGQLFCG